MSSSIIRRLNRAEITAAEPDVGTGILGDKFAPPEAAVPVLLRPRLFDALTHTTEQRVTALGAPAGSGKTMLLATWLQARQVPPFAWLSLDQDDNEARVFWSYVLEALRRGCPAAAAPLADLTLPDRIDDGFVGRFVDAVGRLRVPVVLVLDDVHELHDETVLAGLETLLRHTPPSLRLVLSGRGHPAMPLARLRVSGDLVDIGFAELACTPAEARELFTLFGMDLTDQQIELVLEHTEGWMTGLRLAGLWWHSQPPRKRDIADFTGDARFVADYLSDEVLHPQPPAVQRFLLRTCLVEAVNGDLADNLTGDHDGARILDELERENALVAAVDPHRTSFRYRALLRDFLRAELNREMPDEIPSLRRRAARWYARRSEIIEALRNAVDAEDTDFAARLLVDHGYRQLAGGQAGALEPILARIPDSRVRADPELAAVYAHARLMKADPDGAEPYLRVAERVERIGEPDDGTGADRLGAELRVAELRLFQASLRGHVSQQEIDRAYRVLDRAADGAVLPDEQAALGALAFRLGIAHLWNGQSVSAKAAFERALSQLGQGGYDGWIRQASGWHALLNASGGRLVAAAETISALGLAPTGHARDRAAGRKTLTDLIEAFICFERDHLDEAWALLDPPVFSSAGLAPGDGGELPMAAAAALVRARILMARGAYRAARAELALARQPSAGLTTYLRHRADLLEAEILLQQGDTEAAGVVLAAAACPIPGLALTAVAIGGLRLAEADPAGALTCVMPCLHGTTAETRLLDTVAAHLVAACAHRRLGAPAVAREHLEQALALAEPDGLVRVFVEAGRTVRSLLTVVIPPDGPYASIRATLLHHFEAQSATPVPAGRYITPLTAVGQHDQVTPAHPVPQARRRQPARGNLQGAPARPAPLTPRRARRPACRNGSYIPRILAF